ncbi:hypothetical protein GUJ93_ZPchr0007g3916 [Zizania palustris]|uniref:Uncharacterized protein n=1 Tax=Zizania palustris TaxID=103762 RepID=A0A8J5SQM7_ZIZPA|nr:hypothetical protein GUJ93_ZPchr0007g3916 [Zizania palustris]
MLAVVVVAVAVLLPLTTAQPMQESTCASDAYAANSTYQANLGVLAAALPANASATPDGYVTATVGVVPDQVSALALCRSDVNASSCRACRFLDFVGTNSPVSVLHSDGNNITGAVPVAWFNAAVLALMNATANLAVAAGNNATKKYFATAVEDFDPKHYPKIYGMAQCAPVMTVAQCRSCLSGFVASIPWWLNGKPGGRVLGIWCNLRYNVKPFYSGQPMLKLSAPPAPPPVVPSPAAAQTSTERKRRIAGISAGVACFVVFMLILSAWGFIRSKRNKATKKDSLLKKMARGKCTIFDLPTLQEATENFSEKHKLGEGGFGTVYKGKLPDGQEIAVKKLLESCGNGLHQQYNEVMVLAALQHKNLVRLQGFCVHKNDMLLVYEYIKNGSLDNFLFDVGTGNTLSWDQQYNIIIGIAKGIILRTGKAARRRPHRYKDNQNCWNIRIYGTRRKNCSSDNGSSDAVNLLSYVWSCWTKDPDDRPDIPSVIFMLTRDNMELQSPTQPAFFFDRDSNSASQQSDQRVFVYDRSGAIYEEDISVNGITLTEEKAFVLLVLKAENKVSVIFLVPRHIIEHLLCASSRLPPPSHGTPSIFSLNAHASNIPAICSFSGLLGPTSPPRHSPAFTESLGRQPSLLAVLDRCLCFHG